MHTNTHTYTQNTHAHTHTHTHTYTHTHIHTHTNMLLAAQALDGAIHAAIRQQQPAFVQRLLALGFEVNHADKEGDLPIHIACKGGSIEILQLLLSIPSIQVDKPDIVRGCARVACVCVCVCVCVCSCACACCHVRRMGTPFFIIMLGCVCVFDVCMTETQCVCTYVMLGR